MNKPIQIDTKLNRRLGRVAKDWGISVDELIQNVLEQKVAAHESHHPRHEYVRHGGKHLMGASTGYEVTADGRYYPAPSWTATFDRLNAERAAIHGLATTVVRECNERLVDIEQAIQKAKGGLVKDLQLDPSKNWVYHFTDQCLYEYSEEPAERND